MEQEIAVSNNLAVSDFSEDDPILGFKLKLIKMKVNALLEELQTFEGGGAAKRKINLEQGIDFYDEIQRFEIDLIINALKCTRGHQSKAARILNVKLSTLNAKIKHYKIPVSEMELTQAFPSVRKEKSARQPALPPEDQAEQIALANY